MLHGAGGRRGGEEEAGPAEVVAVRREQGDGTVDVFWQVHMVAI